MTYTRREVVRMGAGAGAGLFLGVRPRLPQTALITRVIPSSGERIPVVGIGARNYRVGDGWAPDTNELRATLRTFHELGGRLIDSSPNYGASETIVGELLEGLGIRDDLFLATKVDRQTRAEGITRMERSLQRLRTGHFDLMQVHNLRGWAEQLPNLREWKRDGRIRHVGVTTSSARQYEELERIMRQEELDFIQVDYAADARTAAERVLPLAADRGMAVVINLPFGRGRLFSRVGDRALPDWASEFDCESWGQFFLKYVVSHPAVTAAIPGTTQSHHAVDNIGAATGHLPTPELRRRMEEFVDALPAAPRRQRR